MMASKKNLLTFGYVREHCRNQNIDLFPDDIVQLFVEWLLINDCFDKQLSHPSLTIITSIDDNYELLCFQSKQFEDDWASAVGTMIVSKGQRVEWKFKINGPLINNAEMMIGIIDNEMIPANKPINVFCDRKCKGWGVYCYNMWKMHDSDCADGGPFNYGYQFEYAKGDIITMILDLSQKKNESGVLSFDINAKLKYEEKDFVSMNILYDDLDIDKEYRMAICIDQGPQASISLLLEDFLK